MPFQRIDHVQLAMPAGKEDEARLFYVKALGLEEIPKPAELTKRGGAWFTSGEVMLHLGIVQDKHPFEGKPHCYIADPFGNRIELIAR
jgi:catechol 2,3-dioxygenase-like lactoylglutathione lyase family enzyme